VVLWQVPTFIIAAHRIISLLSHTMPLMTICSQPLTSRCFEVSQN